MNNARLRSYHDELSRCRWLDEVMARMPYNDPRADAGLYEAAKTIWDAHMRRVNGEGSPAECDRVAKEVLG